MAQSELVSAKAVGSLSIEDRMRILANLLLDRIISDLKNGHLKLSK